MRDCRFRVIPKRVAAATALVLATLLSACGGSTSAGGGSGGAGGGFGGAAGGERAGGGAAGAPASGSGGSSPGAAGGLDGGSTGGAPGAAGAQGGGAAGRATGGAAGAAAAACPAHGTLPAGSWAVRLADAVLARWPDPANITTPAGWEYNHGIVLRGVQQVWNHTCDPRYVAYIQKYADENVSAAGVVNIPAAHSFDNIQPSVLLPFLFQRTGLAKYRTAADQIRARYDDIPTNADGGFWHKQTYPNQMWLDSMYMGEPFLARYGAVFGTCGSFCSDTVFKQMLLLAAHVRDPATGLLYHAWDDSPAGKTASWADPTTGRSPIVWDRALGWYTMAIVDMLPDLPAGPNRDSLVSILSGIAAALKAFQDPATGLWFEVVDQGSHDDDWVESSGSGMFVYALKVAVDGGFLDPTYLPVATRGWQGLQTKLTVDASGLPSISGAVQGVSVQGNYAGYINQKTLTNSSHGLCGILLAASEMEAR